MEQSEYILIYNGGRFNLLNALGNKPGFIWSKY